MNKEILNRKGARKAEDIPSDVLSLLNKGSIETVNLTEWLAIDHSTLIENQFKSAGVSTGKTKQILTSINEQKKPSTLNTTKLVGGLLYDQYKDDKAYPKIYKNLRTNQSDSIRCYAPYLISLNTNLSIEEKLEKAKELVADKHFGVREVVWMALRPEIAVNLKESIAYLTKWTQSEDENIRRFATEAIRPRGVWCKHIEKLKEQPELAINILTALKSDPSKYVQDSVGNWLNDASKSNPNFVIEVCDKWRVESPTKETAKIIKRARRTLDKK